MSENNDELLFHRHCQATVLSAYGIGGQGATWDTINNLPLPNLQNILPTWRTYFSDNYNNITEDLAAILELIDFVVGKLKPQVYKISFKNNNDESIVPEQELEPNTIFRGFGRDIELTVNDQTLQFNTMVAGGQDKLSITIPIPTLSEGDLVDVSTDGTSNTISVRNNIPEGYVGSIGINENRELVDYTPPQPKAKLTQEMFNQLWPIGSIYISVNPYQPFQGIPDVTSTWEQLLTGRALWNVPTDFESLGGELDGILPNHHHSVDTPRYVACEDLYSTFKGAGYISKQASNTTSTELDEGVASEVTVGDNLRPPSIAVTMWKRIS